MNPNLRLWQPHHVPTRDLRLRFREVSPGLGSENTYVLGAGAFSEIVRKARKLYILVQRDVCMYGHYIYSKSKDQPVKVANPVRCQLNISLSRSRLRIWSRETGWAIPPCVSPPISILRLNLVLTHEIPPDFRGGVHYVSPYVIGSVPSLSGHAIRVRRHRAGKPQGSSKRVLSWPVTMDQLIRASLFPHTRYWYEVGMLKVS